MLVPLLALLLSPGPGPDRIFSCSFGTRQAEVIGTADSVTYRFGRPGKPDITLTGNAAGGVFYHTTGYARGQDQTLRFVSGAYDYVVFNRWVAPFQKSDGSIDAEINASGVLIRRNGKTIRRLDCVKDGDFREWAVFKKLQRDQDNLVPDDIG